MAYVNLTYSSLERHEAGLKAHVAGISDREDGSINPAFRNVQPGDRVIMYSKEVHGVVGIGEATTGMYRDTTPVWADGVYPSRIGLNVLVYFPEGLPLETIIEETGESSLAFLHIANMRTDTDKTNRINTYIWNRLKI